MMEQIKEYLEMYPLLNIWLPPMITVAIGILAGWVFKSFIHSRVKKLTSKTQWKYDDIIFTAISTRIVLWFFLVVLYIAAGDLEIYAPYNEYVAKIAITLMMLSVTMASSTMTIDLLNEWSASKGSRFPSTAIFSNLARITIIAIGLMIILQSFGISIAPILTALGVGGLAVSLALKDTLSDFFAGLHILLSQKVRIGDFVQLESGEMGYISNITWRNTTMVERANNVISIPNNKLSQSITKNFDLKDTSYSIKIPVGVAYDSDLEQVERVTMEVAQSVIDDLDEANKDYDPIVRFQVFDDSSINFTVYMRAGRYGDHHPMIHEFIKHLHKRFDEEGIEIPFPMRTVVQKSSSE
ncbi:MAG TPA: mechanosensitive ion channel family protein [Candidatus Marinimicrobia bacterium]|jgi:small-conductance mechanosensitive channel|nr:mechanosensitive ion channel protein MscS [Candidatus Neomarinimicrobiota bacterium]MDP6276634.1 mechanosensitive ion channel family protein [Candidatus Neomarinimicrobiota bacterium]MDP7216901.1 mechanosensitive ion channel family protein [Candidatus Neomarinimicrobiota bacterium]MDP7436644.1 mechanosensitive ion channel family protein [Candidatus Neomarinimicrobiota bacterium]HJL74989.1 mechanosensitive ion channel family protein [Candidatus Neomarinimicrobiota bacterium]|tara:strand:+ start:10585 stop:11646 length:1062 start_codon:yes stop_codon:yes gene_type:complete